MKRGTPRHPKVYDLCEYAKIRRPVALGYLELLWHFAAEFAPQGDIGQYSDKRIEAAMDWAGRSGRLLDFLVQARWVDMSKRYRLLVHDWHDHADDAVKKRLQRSNLLFLSSQDDTDKVTGLRQTTADNGSLPKPLPKPLPEPGPTHTLRSRTTNGRPPAWATIAFNEFWELVWLKKAPGAARSEYFRKAKTPEMAEHINSQARAQRDRIIAAAHGEERFLVHPRTWLHQERYDDKPTELALVPEQRPLDYGERRKAKFDEKFDRLMRKEIENGTIQQS